MTPTFRYPTYELLSVSGSADDLAVLRAALPADGPAVALTPLTRLECLQPHLRAEDSTCPDLILLDLALPESLQVIQMIKSDPALHEIPLIAMIPNLTPEDCRAAYEAQVNCCLDRPRDRDEREEVLRLLLEYWFRIACLPLRAGRATPGTLDW